MILIGLHAANTKGEPPGGTPAEITGEGITGEGITEHEALNEETTFPG